MAEEQPGAGQLSASSSAGGCGQSWAPSWACTQAQPGGRNSRLASFRLPPRQQSLKLPGWALLTAGSGFWGQRTLSWAVRQASRRAGLTAASAGRRWEWVWQVAWAGNPASGGHSPGHRPRQGPLGAWYLSGRQVWAAKQRLGKFTSCPSKAHRLFGMGLGMCSPVPKALPKEPWGPQTAVEKAGGGGELRSREASNPTPAAH